MPKVIRIILFVFIVTTFSACGVKKPPIPLYTTPGDAPFVDSSPTPEPNPQASPESQP